MSADFRKVFSTVGISLAVPSATQKWTPTTPAWLATLGRTVSISSSSFFFKVLNRSVAINLPSPGPSEYRKLQTDRDMFRKYGIIFRVHSEGLFNLLKYAGPATTPRSSPS